MESLIVSSIGFFCGSGLIQSQVQFTMKILLYHPGLGYSIMGALNFSLI